MGLQARVVVVVGLAALLSATVARAQVRTTGRINGTLKDPSGAVVPHADLVLEDAGSGLVSNGHSDNDGGFVFPNLQPGRYRLTAVAQRFQPANIEGVAVDTGRATNVEMRFEIAGVQEKVQVVGSSPIIETTSSTVSTTVRNEQIAKLPLSGRDVLGFALLTPGAATSCTNRYSTFNGLPGGAINITLDGINNNSQRFRSGNTSFFGFAPIRMGAVDQVTVSTAGLTADAGAEGAVQVQFVTKRGSNDLAAVRPVAKRRAECQQLAEQRTRASESDASAERVQRQHRRRHHQEQAVLLRQLRAGDPAGAKHADAAGAHVRSAARRLPLQGNRWQRAR